MKTPRLPRALEMPRRSFLNVAAATLSSFAAIRLQAQSAERTRPIGDGKLRIIVFGRTPTTVSQRWRTGAKWAAQGTTSSSSPARTATSAIGAWRRDSGSTPCAEVKKCAEILGNHVQVLDIHDGELMVTMEIAG